MKKWIRNIIFILALIFSFKSTAQNEMTITSDNYNKWLLSNQTCAGCGSFYVMVVNNPNPRNGYYYYDIYCWTNSAYSNGVVASTYLKNLNFYALTNQGQYAWLFNMQYAVVPPKSQFFNGYFYLAYVYTLNSNQTIKVTWSQATAW